jgi:hypothetical protein
MPLRNPRGLRTGVVKESTGRISTETSTSSTSSSTSHRVSTAAPQSLCPLNCRSSERESPLAMVTKLEPALTMKKKPHHIPNLKLTAKTNPHTQYHYHPALRGPTVNVELVDPSPRRMFIVSLVLLMQSRQNARFFARSRLDAGPFSAKAVHTAW